MRTICIFCGRRANSVEHAWPRWLLALITEVGTGSGTEAQFGPDGSPVRYWHGPEIKVKGVCVTCNTGWMSNLETQAKLILASMIADIAVPLTSQTQALLLRWIVKTAMVFDSLNRERFYSNAEREQLRNGTALPANTKVWLGRYAQSNLLSGEARFLRARKVDRNPFDDGYVTTFVVRRLVVQMLTIRRRPEFIAVKAILHTKAGPWKRALIEISPTSETVVQWPPLISLSDATIDFRELSRRFVLQK